MDDTLYTEPSTISIWPYVVYGVLALIAIFALFALLFWLKKRLMRPELVGMTREQIAARWIEIRKTSQMGLMGAKLAIVEADTLLDSGLKSMMMPGETLGERLKVACYKYPKLQNVWWAHKLRNSIAHEATFNITSREAARAVDEFEKALKILNVL